MENFWSDYGSQLIISVIILVITYLVNRILNTIIKKIIKRHKEKSITTILLFIKRLKTVIVYIIGAVFIIAQFQGFNSFSITVLSILGGAGAIIGLAFKEVLNNFFGSLELVLSKPFQVGDFVKLPEKGVYGTVEEISTRHSIIRTINNEREIIPNYLLNTLIIENSDFKDNQIVLFGEYLVSYKEDLEKVVNIVKEEITKICDVTLTGPNKDAEFPKVRVISWDSSGIKIRAWIWGNDVGEAYENFWKFNYELKVRFDKENIEIPYDYVNVIMKNEKK